MLRAYQLAAVGVAVLGCLRVRLHGLSACGEQLVGLLPHGLRHDGRHAVILVDEPLVFAQTVAAFVAVVARGVPPTGIAALVFRVADHAVQRGVGERLALPSTYTAAVQVVGNGAETEVSGSVALEHLADDGGFRLDNLQSPVNLVVPEQIVLPEQHAVLLRTLKAEARAFGQLAHLVLCDGGHDGEPQFGILVKGVDVVVLKVHAHAAAQQLARVAQTVECISGETADLLGDDEVKAAAFRVLDHLEKLLTSLDRRAADALIDVAAGKPPVRICGDVVLKIAFLVAETVDLLVFVGRNAGIVRHSKLGIEDAAALRLHFVQSADVHQAASLRRAVQPGQLVRLHMADKIVLVAGDAAALQHFIVERENLVDLCTLKVVGHGNSSFW